MLPWRLKAKPDQIKSRLLITTHSEFQRDIKGVTSWSCVCALLPSCGALNMWHNETSYSVN